ncbi:hypothetical protein Thal_0039 [Thermocrinis albus DSM 14484]|uniref:Type IV pilus assembly protein PilW n=1 Tax=Thermocrinis albus (strain DSM 14484 / JCM 11386 / HI 11/12) TaxID=638303 RepID=D3SNE0_THEAH|nr:type II secretion system protein [Thermocrinis albus]ADC88677.1 hypothetical protein Thal_0039 [Thermocrinis albus DSM 14484]
MRDKRGMTLVELLVGIVLFVILGAGIITLYRTFVAQRIASSTLVKTEGDLIYFQQLLERITKNAGFGIPANQQVFSYDNGVFSFNSLAVRQENGIGCWRTSTFTAPSDINGRTCPNDGYNICLDSQKRIAPPDRSVACFFTGSRTLDDLGDFLVRIFTSDDNLPRECLDERDETSGRPKLKNLMIQVGNDVPQPIVSCVSDFKVRFLVQDPNNGIVKIQDSPPNDVRLLKGVRYCFFVQLIEEKRKEPTKEVVTSYIIKSYIQPTFSNECGGTPISVQNWEAVKWATVEMNVELPNLR